VQEGICTLQESLAYVCISADPMQSRDDLFL
jgi:hypothetical protein